MVLMIPWWRLGKSEGSITGTYQILVTEIILTLDVVFSVVKCRRTLENSNSSFVLAFLSFWLPSSLLYAHSLPPDGRSEDFHYSFFSFLFFLFSFFFCEEYNCGEIRLRWWSQASLLLLRYARQTHLLMSLEL